MLWWKKKDEHVHRWRLESKTLDAFGHTHLLYHCATCAKFVKHDMPGREPADMGPRSTEFDELAIH